MFSKLKKSLFIFILSLLAFSYAESTSIPGLFRYRLDNGLQLFVAENDAAPLAYIEIAVRAGAVTQTPKTAGLFHLYEHMMFKGNEKYENSQAFNDGANELGQIDQNGSTGEDRVNYFFTIPSDLVRQGLEFWSYAVRTPKIDEQELENEKSVVLSEITGSFSDPSRIRYAALCKALFPNSPWRSDPSGYPAVIKEATPDILREIQRRYYIPSNSALFVGGNVNHDEVFSYVKEIFSDWANPESPIPFALPEARDTFTADKKLVFVNPGASPNLIQLAFYLRGPDGETDRGDTYSADVWASLANNPKGLFAKTFLSEPAMEIPESDYIGTSYLTSRVSGRIGFFAATQNSEKPADSPEYGIGKVHAYKKDYLNPAEKADEFLAILREKAIPAMLNKDEFFKDDGIFRVKQQLEDSRIYELESAKAILASLSSAWASCGPEYFFTYDQNIARVNEDNVIEFVQKYIQDKYGVLIVSVSPDVWEEYKVNFLKMGYERITAENAFWHRSYKPESETVHENLEETASEND
ncbi:pitrilysin family protein [Treponema sp.]|uniref:M16 family metallopeptidase n=1 Tax=Treponema sp. TaxID=166 RepID=UPI0025E6A2EA|nr:pitrilysin family protein [Treponema sp.]MBR4323289.1 insulinase family protein [Treponema sp.]